MKKVVSKDVMKKKEVDKRIKKKRVIIISQINKPIKNIPYLFRPERTPSPIQASRNKHLLNSNHIYEVIHPPPPFWETAKLLRENFM